MWRVLLNGSWQPAASEAQIADWIRQGHVGPQTLVQHATWPNAIPVVQVPNFSPMFGGARAGWPQQPPPPPQSPPRVGRTLAIVLGSVFLVGGTCNVLMWASAHGTAPSPSESVAVHKDAAPFVSTLALLVANPKASKPLKTSVDKEEHETDFEFGASADSPMPEFTLSVRQSNAAAWKIFWITPANPFPAQDFAPTGGLSTLPPHPAFDGVYELIDGPLKGAILEWSMGAGNVSSLESVAYAAEEGGPVSAWLCAHGRVPGVKAMGSSDFTFQGEQMVKEKLLSPSSAEFPGIFDHVPDTVGKHCTRSWKAWVEAQNAFGVKIHQTFICSQDPATNLVSLTMDPL